MTDRDAQDAKILTINKKPIFNNRTSKNDDKLGTVLDREWLKHTFLLDEKTYSEVSDRTNRYYNSAENKFTDTTWGGNIGVNSRPQFTRYSDIRVKGKLRGRRDTTVTAFYGNLGMGRQYSEAIDDPAQTIYLSFGVAHFNSLANFLSKSFDYDALTLAKQGRKRSILGQLAKAATTIARFITFPLVSTAIWFGLTGLELIIKSTSRFYSIKHTMHLYWSAVTNLVQAISVNSGLAPKYLNENKQEQEIGAPFVIDKYYIEYLSEIMPDIITSEGYIDVYSFANRAQRMANKADAEEFLRSNNSDLYDFFGIVKNGLRNQYSRNTRFINADGGKNLKSRLDEVFNFNQFVTKDDQSRIEYDPTVNIEDAANITSNKNRSFFSMFKDDLNAEMRDGSRYAIFKVDSTGSVSESFGNSSVESEVSQKLNGTSSQIRDFNFAMAGGNVVGETIQGVMQTVGDIIGGAASGLTAGFSDVLAGLAGGGFIDIPKHWQSSTASLPRSTYNMQLISPYNNVISRIQNIYLPLCMLLAGTLPLSTGRNSYVSPFLCELFDRGRCIVPLGMIESLSINRGTSNLPFDTRGNALCIDVSFTVADFSTIMHMPVSDGILNSAEVFLDNNNLLSQYMSVLSGESLYNRIFPFSKIKKAVATYELKFKTFHSPAWAAGALHESSALSPVFSVIEAFNTGSRLIR